MTDLTHPTDPNAIDPATAAQFRAASPHQSVWVSAHAGTGKTRVLTYRVLRLLIDGAEPSEILALTYTRNAATEMRNRIYDTIMTWPYLEKANLIKACKDIGIASPSEDQLERARNLFARLLDATAFLRIETIHAFCQSVLRRFPREAGINPYFRVMEETQSRQIKQTALARTLSLSGDTINDALERLALVRDVDQIMELIREMGSYPALLEQASKSPSEVKRLVFEYMGCEDAVDDPGRVHQLINALAHPDAKAEELLWRIVEAMSEYGTVTEKAKAKALESWLNADHDKRHDQMLDYLKIFLTESEGKVLSRLLTKAVDENYPDLKTEMAFHGNMLRSQLKAIHALDTAQNSFDLIQLARTEFDHYQSLKWQRGMMDYDDLIRMTARLLKDSGVAWVRYKLDQGIRYLMIDEAQDTSPEQWRIFDQLFDDQLNDQTDMKDNQKPNRTVFSVGDYKQSIYSFQGADPNQFSEQGDYVAQASAQYGRPFEQVELNTSFRTAAPILSLVDEVIGAAENAPHLSGIGRPSPHQCHRKGVDGWVHLDMPSKPSDQDTDTNDVIISHAKHIASTIKKMIGSIYLPSVERLARAGDILILLRKRDSFYNALHRELQAEGIPLTGADRIKLMDDIASLDLVALGEVMLLPEDNLTLAAVLKSPLFGLTEDQLYHLARNRGAKETLFARLAKNPDADEAVAQAYDRLLELMGIAEQSGVHEFYNKVLDMDTRAAFIQRQGLPVLDILGEFLEHAQRYENEHTGSMLGFLQTMQADDTDIKRDEDGDIKAVRIMTVHGAKGLEAPIVMIPDTFRMTAINNTLRPVQVDGLEDSLPLFSAATRFVPVKADAVMDASDMAKQAIEEEGHRLLYVAMTRAEDGLYIGAFEKRQSRFEDDSWYQRIAAAMAKCGAEQTENGWFYGAYPAIPDLNTHSDDSQRFSPDMPSEITSDIPLWVNQPPSDEPLPPRPITPSRLSLPQTVGSITGTARKDAILRGQIIHRLLETLPMLDNNLRDVAAARIINAHAHGAAADDEKVKRKWLDEATAIMNMPELAALFSSQAFAETPVNGLVGNTAVSGVIDRLVITDEVVIFVDFKTGQCPDTLSSVSPSYISQMGLYAHLLEKIYPKKQIKAGLIYTEAPRVFWLNKDMLEDAVKTFSHIPETAS